MDKNLYFVEEPDKADNSSKPDSDEEQFVSRVTKNGIVLKFKVGKYGTVPSSSNGLSQEHTFSKKQNARDPLKIFEANCTQSVLEQSDIRNAGSRDNKIPFLDSTMGTNQDEEIRRAEMVNNSSKEDGQMVSLKSVAMDTFMTGINETVSSQNAEIYSTKNVINGTCLMGNRKASASEKSFSCEREEYICHQCGKRFWNTHSFYGHTGGHVRDEYQLIRTMLEQPFETDTSYTMINMKEIKSIWKAAQALLNVSMVSGRHPVHSTKLTDLTCSSKDISGVTAQMMEVADVLIKLSQTVIQDDVKVFKCTTCHKIFGSYQALRGHMSGHNKKPKTRQPVYTAGNSSGSSKRETMMFRCNKCNQGFPTGPMLGGHKRKHYFEEQRKIKPVTDGNVRAPVSLPRYTMQASGAVLPVHDDVQFVETALKGVDDTTNLLVPKPYDAVQPLQANNLTNETEEPSGVDEIVID